MGITHDLCQAIHATSYESLGDDCIERVKEAIKDGVAVGLAGCKSPQVAISVEHMRSLGGAPQASVWGWGFKASVVQAAYINGCATHVLDFEPMWTPPTHAVSPTVPVAFALAEARPATGKQVIAAVAKGLEIQGRLQFAGDAHDSELSMFHSPGITGVFGSAVVAAELLHLDVQATQYALGLAASRAGSLFPNIGSMTKCTHCGHAGASGLDAALLAERGFTASPDIIETRRGVAEVFYPGGFDYAKLLAFGRPFRVVDPGLAIKLFPSQYATHYAITAGLQLASQIPDKSKIARVRIVAPAQKYIDRAQPVNGLDAKHSMQYTAAAAILDGVVNIDTFLDERRFRDDMVDLLSKTVLIQDESIPNPLDKMRVEIEVALSDGRRLEAICRGPKGVWGIPLDPCDHRAKLEDCLGRALSPLHVSELLNMLADLQNLNASSVKKVVSLLATADVVT